MTPEISVTILSSSRMLAEALESVLAEESGLRVVVARDGRQDGGEPRRVDVVLIDASTNRDVALAQTWMAQERFDGAPLVVLGLEGEDEVILDFIQAGAAGYVLKHASRAALVQAIEAAFSGEALCSPQVAAAVLQRILQMAGEGSPPAEDRGEEQLTGRELDILALMARGLGNKEIGHTLGITVQTVKNHVHNILEKLGVHRRREAVRIAYERGLLRDGQSPPWISPGP